MRVKVYEVDAEGHETCTGIHDTRECFPGPENDAERALAEAELQRTNRYWGGGGASPLFLLLREFSQ